MIASVIGLIATHAELPTWLVKVIGVLVVVCLVVIVAALGFHSASSYLANERAVAVEIARQGAAAEVGAKVNAATAAALDSSIKEQAAAMSKLNARKASDDAMWAGFEEVIREIESEAPAPAPVPAAIPAPKAPKTASPPLAQKAPAHVPSKAFSDFVRADADADRLLERATAGSSQR